MIEDLSPTMKIIVIGNGQVGKTTLTVKFVKDVFTTEYKKTLGVDFLTIKKYIKKLDREIEFQIWDTAGQDYYNAITRRYYKGADAALIVFSINDKESFENVKSWHEKVIQECGNIAMALVMSKVDIKDDIKVTMEDAEKLAKNLKLNLFKVSSKTGENINECFEYLACEHYSHNGFNSTGLENIENVQKNSKNNFDGNCNDDIKEIPSEDKKNKKTEAKEEKIEGFILGTKSLQKKKNKKSGGFC